MNANDDGDRPAKPAAELAAAAEPIGAPESPAPASSPADESPAPALRTDHNRLRMAILLIIVIWTYAYNTLIKGFGPVRGFFEILDTISDDFVMGGLVTIALGLLIVAAYSVTRLYSQIIANIHSFRIMEDLVSTDFRAGRYRDFAAKVIRFEEQPLPQSTCPTRVSSLLFSFSFIYVMSWVYLVLFSEALFFVSWSAGVDLPINEGNVLLLPTLALAIPFSARVMAFLRYPYAQAYADFMPGAVFVLMVVFALGNLFESDDQKFFLSQLALDREMKILFLRNGLFLAFLPVFFEACIWIYELYREELSYTGGRQDIGVRDVAAGLDEEPPDASHPIDPQPKPTDTHPPHHNE
ncbi:MAG: hypothetical protein EA381_10540 [Planctomycetaceae bacterium]|nr:MAG: hypothetical protein EA381_10540 [Planctomycetaceae bacterium]